MILLDFALWPLMVLLPLWAPDGLVRAVVHDDAGRMVLVDRFRAETGGVVSCIDGTCSATDDMRAAGWLLRDAAVGRGYEVQLHRGATWWTPMQHVATKAALQ